MYYRFVNLAFVVALVYFKTPLGLNKKQIGKEPMF